MLAEFLQPLLAWLGIDLVAFLLIVIAFLLWRD